MGNQTFPNDQQRRPLPVICRVTTARIGVITPVTHLFMAIYCPYVSMYNKKGHLVGWMYGIWICIFISIHLPTRYQEYHKFEEMLHRPLSTQYGFPAFHHTLPDQPNPTSPPLKTPSPQRVMQAKAKWRDHQGLHRWWCSPSSTQWRFFFAILRGSMHVWYKLLVFSAGRGREEKYSGK